jgi:cytochrome c peroxidase
MNLLSESNPNPKPEPASVTRRLVRKLKVDSMRTIKLSMILLLFVTAVLTVSNRLLPIFKAAGQTGATLSAPIEVSASDNAYATKVAVSWAPVRGATLYRVFRNTVNDSTTATNLGVTAAATFFDTTAVPTQVYFFWVRAENGSVVGNLSAPDQGVRANGVGPVQPFNPPPEPAGNAVTAAKAYLGKALFWDEQLSSTRTVACGTCHFAANGGSDARATIGSPRSTNPGADLIFGTPDDVFASPGVISNNVDGTYNLSPTYGLREQVTGRKSRSYIDAGYSSSLFWDGRATQVFTDPISGSVVLPAGAALESQVLGPPVSSTEMAHAGRDWNDVAARVAASKPLALSPAIPAGLSAWIDNRTYPELFQEAFGSSDVTPARIAMAIATFERTLYSDQTRFDQSAAQIITLTPAETRGQGVFNQSRCNVCHAGSLFSDNQFHNIGVRPQNEDTGRFQVTGNVNNIGEFRTPSLRNVGLRGPYMNDGHFATLEDVVAFYNRGGDFNAPNIDHNLIRPLGLSPQQQSDLVAFLRGALTDPRVAAGTSPFDRPTLYSESNRVPQITGAGTPGTGGNIPQVTAVEPPVIGNPNFTIGISNALGGASATLVIDSKDPGTGPTIPATASFARTNVTLSGSGPGNGFSSVVLKIPSDATLIGTTYFGRWFVTDANAAGRVAVTPAFKMTVFGAAINAATNPIDDAQTFVTQQYRDFLNREPDAGGLAYWTDQITGASTNTPCPVTDTTCMVNRRINVSAAFFVENEFQQTGSYVYELYAGALGRAPNFTEFAPDRAQVIGGASLDQMKASFADSFVQRAEFTARYPQTLTRDQFVDALLQTMTTRSGLNLSSLRSTMLRDYDNGGRSLVVRDAVQANAFVQEEYNKAFVWMEYFGYLRRQQDQGGYDFWLNVLSNNEPGNLRGMVCAFITSAEYQSRFSSVFTHSNADCSGIR